MNFRKCSISGVCISVVYAYCTGPIYTMETAACNDTTKFQLVGFTICHGSSQWFRYFLIYLNFALLRASIMSVRGVRPSIHHAASKVNQVAIDLQLWWNSLSSLYVCLHCFPFNPDSLHDSSAIALLPVFTTSCFWHFLPVWELLCGNL